MSSVSALTKAFSLIFANFITLDLLYLPIVCLIIASIVVIFRKFIRI